MPIPHNQMCNKIIKPLVFLPEAIKISIITIVRNGMPFIEQTVRSVLCQSYKNVQYIVIDGKSTDGTCEILEKYVSDKRFTYLSQSDDGLSDAFNKGLYRAAGDYLLFLNSDDFLINDDAISLMVDCIGLHNYPEVIYGDCEVIDRDSSETLYIASINFCKRAIYQGKFFPHPSTFTKKSYFEKYGIFDCNFKIAMDFELYLRGIRHEKIFHANLLTTKVRNDGISTKNQNLVIKEIILALKKNGYVPNIIYSAKLLGEFYVRKYARLFLIKINLYSYFKIKKN